MELFDDELICSVELSIAGGLSNLLEEDADSKGDQTFST